MDQNPTLAGRLWAKVQRSSNGCLEYTGARLPKGYGFIRARRADGSHFMTAASRAAWLVTYGDIPEGMQVCHRCDNPPCCEPTHLFLGTTQENTADRVAKSRTARGLALPQTKLSAADMDAVRAMYSSGALTQRQVALRLGINQATVSRILSGKARVTA
jgi:hypothetical protein